MEQQAYKTIFFDLDGTLLPMDIDEFLQKYLTLIGEYAASIGLDSTRFGDALARGVRAMATDASDRLNEDVFWSTFHEAYGSDDPQIKATVTKFYTTEFPHIGDAVVPNPAAARAVNTLREKGYTLFLTTMPLFPPPGVTERLKWADVDPDAFDRITTYDNSFAAKPDLRYFRQNVELAGCKPEEILMVGNNTREDLAALELGCDAYLVTDWLLDPDGFPIDTVKHGSLEDFADFAERLPRCEEAR